MKQIGEVEATITVDTTRLREINERIREIGEHFHMSGVAAFMAAEAARKFAEQQLIAHTYIPDAIRHSGLPDDEQIRLTQVLENLAAQFAPPIDLSALNAATEEWNAWVEAQDRAEYGWRYDIWKNDCAYEEREHDDNQYKVPYDLRTEDVWFWKRWFK